MALRMVWWGAIVVTGTWSAAAGPGTDIRVKLVTDADDPPGLYAFLTTTRSYPCAGYHLRTVVTRERDTVSVRITGPVRPSPCIGSMDEAPGRAYIGNPAAGTYLLRLVYEGEQDLYTLYVTDRVPTIVPLVRTFTSLTY
jgi:hypothetical protein